MADPELVRVLDYILNRSDENTIEVIAAAVVRRKRDLSLFGASGLPDPKTWAHRVAADLNIQGSLEGIRQTVRNMAIEIIKREAPELDDAELAELLNAWVPDPTASSDHNQSRKRLPPEVLFTMVTQFVSYARGTMNPAEEQDLRQDLGAWPDRYWDAFPPVIRSLITEFLKGNLGEDEFSAKLRAGIQVACGNEGV
ncbi:MAG: hypothetical protein SNJ56_02725 [Termitinemataceae bacterium]